MNPKLPTRLTLREFRDGGVVIATDCPSGMQGDLVAFAFSSGATDPRDPDLAVQRAVAQRIIDVFNANA